MEKTEAYQGSDMDESTNNKPDGGPAFPSGDFDRGISLRAYAAIKLRVPDSGIEWLDDMIIRSMRNQFAAMVAQGIHASCSDSESYPDPDRVSEEAYRNAASLLIDGGE